MPDSPNITFANSDKLELKPFCDRLERYLNVEHDFVDGSLVVALDAGFGAGKTTFIDMWRNDLSERRKAGDFVPMPVVLNAWESDHCGDPLLAILASLIEALEAWEGGAQSDHSELKKAVKNVAWFAAGLGSEFAAKWTGLNPVKAGDLATAKSKDREAKTPDFIEIYRKRVEAFKNLHKNLASSFGGDVPKVIVFVDELDRCRPDYAVSYLETIKHIFSIKGMVFVLAIDQEHLANSARALFGQSLNFAEYFRKFCHRIIALPKPNDAGVKRLLEGYVDRYLNVAGKRCSRMNTRNCTQANIVEMAVGLKLRPRQLQEAFRILGHITHSDITEDQSIYWCFGIGALLLSLLKVGDPTSYSNIGKNEMPLNDVARYLMTLVNKRSAYWWFKMYFTGRGTNLKEPEIYRLFHEVGFIEKVIVYDNKELLGQFVEGWGGYEIDLISTIYQKIESADSF